MTPAKNKKRIFFIVIFFILYFNLSKDTEIEKTLWPEYKDNKDFVLLVIGREHTDEQLRAYNERKKFTFPLYPDPKREVFSLFAEKSIPRAYLFNKEGEAVYTSIGYEKEEFGYLMNAIAEALK